MDGDQRGLDVFHRTISEQLNARLSESPRFFGVLVVISTAYAYVLWKFTPDKMPVLVLTSILAYIAVLWSVWYLAALGYAFRFLQNTQHRIEDALGWNAYRPATTGIPPQRIRSISDMFWMLPGIYHAHLSGLCSFLFIIIGGFCWHWAKSRSDVVLGIIPALVAIAITCAVNIHYLRKFRRTHIPPK